jgi:hypothetical protein
VLTACAAAIVPPSRADAVELVEEPWSHAGLAGTLMRPGTPLIGAPPALIIAGSGPTDRDGNGPLVRTNLYRRIAIRLAGTGVASLRYDKRGVGQSAGLLAREDELRFDDLVGDAAAAADDLTERLSAPAAVLVGHSEGALVAILAARRARIAGLVLLAAPGRPLSVVMREQLQKAPLPEHLRRESLDILAALSAGHRVEMVSPELAPAFRPSVQPYLMSQLTIDPAAELSQIRQPVLLVHGERDLQITLADRDALAASGRDVRSVTLAQANHILKRAPADRAANVATYTDPDLPLDPGVMPPVVAFFRALVR